MKSFYYIRRSIRYSPAWSAAYVVISVLTALLPYAFLRTEARFVNTALLFLRGESAQDTLWRVFLLLAAVLSAETVLSVCNQWIYGKLSADVDLAYEQSVIRHCARLPYHVIEDAKTQESVALISSEKISVSGGFQCIIQLMEYLVRIALIILVVMQSSILCGLVLLLLFVLTAYVTAGNGKADYEGYRQVSAHYRRASYMESLLSGRASAAERLIFQTVDKFKAMWRKEHEDGRACFRATSKRNYFHVKLTSCIMILISFAMMMILVIPLQRGGMSPGVYVALVTAILQTASLMSFRLSNLMEQLIANHHYAGEMIAFFGLPQETAQDADADTDMLETLSFEHVTFYYPGSDKPALDDCSFSIDKEGKYAIVGVNGSGKSTIIKLLMKFYDDYEGAIRINGQDLRNISAQKIRGMIATAFQEYTEFEISAAEYLFGDAPVSSEQEKTAADSLRDWSLDMPLTAHLGRLQEEHMGLSGGMWQKLMMIRLLLKETGMKILDEPTSAADPIAEREMFQTFFASAAGGICLVISHRLGGIRDADKIFVMDQGRVTETGDHGTLISKDGIYSRMYQIQKEWYHAT